MNVNIRLNNEYTIDDLIDSEIMTNQNAVFFGVTTEEGGVAILKMEENSLILEIEDEDDYGTDE